MAKKVFVVPPQAVSVNVSVTVGEVASSPAPLVTPTAQAQQPVVPGPRLPTTQVNTSVFAGVPIGTEVAAPYTPPFCMPASDVLRRKVPMLARRGEFVLGDHVHMASC